MLIDLCVCCLLFLDLRGIICGSRPFPRRTRAAERKDAAEARRENARSRARSGRSEKGERAQQSARTREKRGIIGGSRPLLFYFFVGEVEEKQAHVD